MQDRMALKNRVSENCQMQKTTYCVIPSMRTPRKGKTKVTVTESNSGWDEGPGREALVMKGNSKILGSQKCSIHQLQ